MSCDYCKGPCRGVTMNCSLEAFKANPANAEYLASWYAPRTDDRLLTGIRLTALTKTQVDAALAKVRAMWTHPYNNTCPECSFTDDHAEWCGGGAPPTVRYPAAPVPNKCDCGSAPADPTHYDWCATRASA